MQSLVESRPPRGERGGATGWRQPVEELAIPATVQAVLAARIDRLAEREKQVLQTASVIGKSFSERMLRERRRASGGGSRCGPRVAAGRRVPLRGVALPGGGVRLQAPADAGGGLRLAAPRAPDADPRGGGAGDREARPGQARRTRGARSRTTGRRRARPSRRRAGTGGRREWAGDRHPGESLRHWRKVESLLRDAEETEETAELTLEACRWILRLAPELGADPDETAEIFERGLALAEARGDLERRIIFTSTYGVFLGESTGDIAP